MQEAFTQLKSRPNRSNASWFTCEKDQSCTEILCYVQTVDENGTVSAWLCSAPAQLPPCSCVIAFMILYICA